MYKLIIKSLLDVIIALILFLFLLPFLLIIAVCIRFDSSGSIVYKQKRLGKGGKIFLMYKFRTMIDKEREHKEIYGKTDDVTRVGAFLRRSKLDEVLQLINILKGEMSFVGPRPALDNQLEMYDDFSKQRLNVKPGLTGYAQINGNRYLSWDDRWKYDVMYVQRISFITDVKICLKTIFVVIKGEEKFLK